MKFCRLGRGWEGALGSLRNRPVLAASIVLGCCLAVGVAGYLLSWQAWAVYHWRQAQQPMLECDWPVARRHLEACLRVWPDSAETHFHLARCCRRDGELAAARFHLKRAGDLSWLTEAVDLEYLLLLAQAGGVGNVEKTLQGHLKAGHPEGPLILEAMVRGYVQINGIKEAFQYADRWVTRYPDDWQGYFQRGMVLQRFAVTLTPLRLATEDYRRASELNPKQPAIRLKLAQILQFLGRYDQALPYFQSVRHDQPENLEAMIGEIRCFSSLARLPEAAQLADQSLRAHPDNPELAFLKGKLLLDMDAPAEALHWLLLAKKDFEHRNPEYLHVLVQACRLNARPQEAEQYERSAAAIEADLRRVHDITKELEEKTPDDGGLALRLEAAELLARRNQEEEATRWLLGAMQIDPTHPRARKTLAALAKQTGNSLLMDLYRRTPTGR